MNLSFLLQQKKNWLRNATLSMLYSISVFCNIDYNQINLTVPDFETYNREDKPSIQTQSIKKLYCNFSNRNLIDSYFVNIRNDISTALKSVLDCKYTSYPDFIKFISGEIKRKVKTDSTPEFLKKSREKSAAKFSGGSVLFEKLQSFKMFDYLAQKDPYILRNIQFFNDLIAILKESQYFDKNTVFPFTEISLSLASGFEGLINKFPDRPILKKQLDIFLESLEEISNLFMATSFNINYALGEFEKAILKIRIRHMNATKKNPDDPKNENFMEEEIHMTLIEFLKTVVEEIFTLKLNHLISREWSKINDAYTCVVSLLNKEKKEKKESCSEIFFEFGIDFNLLNSMIGIIRTLRYFEPSSNLFVNSVNWFSTSTTLPSHISNSCVFLIMKSFKHDHRNFSRFKSAFTKSNVHFWYEKSLSKYFLTSNFGITNESTLNTIILHHLGDIIIKVEEISKKHFLTLEDNVSNMEGGIDEYALMPIKNEEKKELVKTLKELENELFAYQDLIQHCFTSKDEIQNAVRKQLARSYDIIRKLYCCANTISEESL